MMLSVAPPIDSISRPGSVQFVLIVDDHGPTLDGLKALVEHAGHACVAASSATEALIFCDQNQPSLVITDLSMPGLNGDGLARWLRARYPETPLLLVTGDMLDRSVLLTLEPMFIAVIRKPLEIDSFVVLLNTLMAGSIEPKPRASR